MPRGRPHARRTTALLLVATAPWLAGCGTGTAQDAAPTPVVIPGSTVTIGTEPGEVTPAPAPTAVAGASETAEATKPTPTSEPAPTGEDLVAQVGGAMTGFSTVQVAIGDPTSPPRLTIGLDYTTGALSAAVEASAELPAVVVRLIDGTAYVDAGSGFVAVPPDQFGADETGLLTALATFDLLGDLRTILLGSDVVTPLGAAAIAGRGAEQYELTIDASDLAQPSLVADENAGRITVVLSVDRSGLPVRLDYELPDGTTSRVALSGYGDRVDVTVPPAG